MGQDDQPLPLPNRPLLQPRGWSPKLDLKASEMTEETRGEHLLSLLSALANLGQLVEPCYRFYTDDPAVPWPLQPPPIPSLWSRIDSLSDFVQHSLVQKIRHRREWTPWTCQYGDIDLFDDLIPFAGDDELRDLGRLIVDQRRIFLRVNEQLAQALAVFFGLPAPETERDFQGLRAQAEDYRRQVGAAWMTYQEVKDLIDQLGGAMAEIKSLGARLRERLEPLCARPMADSEEIGDQRADDLIDEATEEPDSRRAIRLLNKALSYGQTGLFAGSAYAELGDRYSDLGDPTRAIEYYTKSLHASTLPNAYVLLSRGQLYYEQEQWEKARADFKRALSIGLYKPDSDWARECLADLRARESD